MRRLIVIVGSWLALASGAAAQPVAAEPAPTPAATPAASETDAGHAAPAAAPDPAANALAPTPQPGPLAAPEIAVPEISAADLSALGISEEKPGVDRSLKFSGFSDFTIYVPVKPDGATSITTPTKTTMYIGNLNLYLSKNLSDSFRTMGEVRFSYLPNGNLDTTAVNGTSLAYTNTLVRDYADQRRLAPWGSIMIQRMYLEWGGLDGLLFIRAGQFLTPYGIWNIDHGSPTYVPIQRPIAIGNDWFPERQTGLEAFGRWDAGSYSTIGYHATFSNGAGPISDYRDLDKNKAFGARLFWDFRKLGLFHLGVSGYYGRYTASYPTFSLMNSDLKVSDRITAQYDALSLAADLQFKYEGLLLQSEIVTQQRKYTSAGRTPQDLPLVGVSNAYPADAFNWACYGLIGYRFSWFALMPFVMFQADDETNDGAYKLHMYMTHVGLNFHPIDEVTIKAEYLYSKAESGVLSKHPLSAVQFQAAWAF